MNALTLLRYVPVLIGLLLTWSLAASDLQAQGFGVGSAEESETEEAEQPSERRAAPIAFRSLTIDAGTTCGVDREGRGWCWGRGFLGNGEDAASYQQSPSPDRVEGGHLFAEIDAGADHTCALDTDGAAWCWGRNGRGQLGDGTRFFHYFKRVPIPVEGGGRFRTIQADAFGTCALGEDDRLLCWGGTDDRGLLHIGPDPEARVPVPYFGEYEWKDIDIQFTSICGVTNDDEGYCWGTVNGYVLGNGAFGSQETPTPVAGDHRWQVIRQGSNHACGLDRNGRAWCWGRSYFGQLGHDGDGQCRGAHSACSTAPMPVDVNERFAQLAVGTETTCALDGEGRAWCWGDGEHGMLADGEVGKHHRQEPRPIDTQLRFSSLTLEGHRACGIERGTGYAWCWGGASDPVTGGSSGVPVQVPPPGTDPRVNPTTQDRSAEEEEVDEPKDVEEEVRGMMNILRFLLDQSDDKKDTQEEGDGQ